MYNKLLCIVNNNNNSSAHSIIIQWSLNSLGPGCVKSLDIHLYTELCSITLIEHTPWRKYFNRAVIATVRLTKLLINQWLHNQLRDHCKFV